MEIELKNQFVGQVGIKMTNVDTTMMELEKTERKTVKREKDLDKDMDDLVEYVKWITNDLGVLMDRVRIAEKIISDLRRTGEESVESLLNNLYAQKKI